MNALALLLLAFAACAALIGRAGYVLSRSADQLARHHGWGRTRVGVAMLATVTSLPELSAGLSAVAWVGAPNLAVGDALGSCVFNLTFLVVVDALQREQPMYRDAATTHLLAAAFGVVMLGLVALSLLLAEQAPRLLHVGFYSPAMIALYLFALASVARQDLAAPQAAGAAPATEGLAAAAAYWRAFVLAALVVLAAGTALPHLAERLVELTGLNRSFVGTLGLAFATSLPEMAVSLAALRLRALDLAIANLLGSNLFNVAVLAIDDVAYLRGPLLADASAAHTATAVTAVVMTGLVIVGLVLRPQGRVLRATSWVSVGLLAGYLLNATVAYLKGG